MLSVDDATNLAVIGLEWDVNNIEERLLSGNKIWNMEKKVKASSKPGKRMSVSKAGSKKCYMDCSWDK